MYQINVARSLVGSPGSACSVVGAGAITRRVLIITVARIVWIVGIGRGAGVVGIIFPRAYV